MATTGVNSLTPQEAARRAERWFGARVDDRTTGKIKIYPADKDQEMVVISDRWSNSYDRLNAVKRLQRVGIDVINGQTPPDSMVKADGRSIDPHLTQKIEIPPREDSPVTAVKPETNGTPTPAAMPRSASPAISKADYEALMAMLAEYEQRVATLTERLDRLDHIEHQNRARYAAQTRLIQDLKERVDTAAAAGGVVEDEAAKAERERMELLAEGIEYLARTGSKLTSGMVALNIGKPEKGNTMGKVFAVAARERRSRLKVQKHGGQLIYWVEPKPEAAG